MRLVTGEDDWLRATRITPRAVAGLEALPRDEQEQAVAVLGAPFRFDRTEKMKQRKDIDLWRVRVNRDVRITYCLEAGAALILHIGRHVASDDFVARYQPRPQSSQPLEEIPLMKNAGKTVPTASHGGPALALPPQPRPLADELVRVLSALVGEVVRDEQHTNRELAFEELDQLRSALLAVHEQLAELVIEQENLAELPARLQELDRALLEQRRQLESTAAERERRRAGPDDLARLLGELHELRLEVRQCSARLDEQARRLQSARSDLQAQLNTLSAQAQALADSCEQRHARQQARAGGWLGWLCRRWRG